MKWFTTLLDAHGTIKNRSCSVIRETMNNVLSSNRLVSVGFYLGPGGWWFWDKVGSTQDAKNIKMKMTLALREREDGGCLKKAFTGKHQRASMIG